MTLVTLYCSGTAFDANSDDIIAWLVQNTANPTGKAAYHVPGPGSDMRVAHMHTSVRWLGQVLDQALGVTVDTVAKGAADFIKALRPRPSTVNIAGWSRGSVTAVLIANQIAPINTNLFLFDPVPGGPNQFLRSRASTIGSNVARCNTVLMNDEVGVASYLFQPLERPFTKGRPGFRVFLLPGTHGSAVRYQNGAETIFYDTTHIGAHLVSKFLGECGTPVAPTRLLSPVDLLSCYARLMHRTVYGQMPGGRPGLTIPNDRRNALFYVNGHHETLFAQEFPAIATYLANGTQGMQMTPTLYAEAQRLRAAAPAMLQVVGAGARVLALYQGASEMTALAEVLGYGAPAPPTDACFNPVTGF